MSINGNGDTLTIKGARLKVSGGVQVSGSIAYTEDATGFGGVAAVIDDDNVTLNITAGKTSGVAKIERSAATSITAVDHTNVSNNTTIHIALKNTSTVKGNFVTIGTFADDGTVKVNYTDEYVIGPGETGMITVRKVAGVLSLFIREMFTSSTTDTTSKPFYIKDGTNYKYPLYTTSGGNLEGVTINGVSYYQPSGGYTTKTRPPLGIPELIVSPSGNLAIGNSLDLTTVNYDVWGVPSSFDFGSIYQGSTKKATFLLENGEASGSFTESGASSGDAYSLYVERTDVSSSDTVTLSLTQANFLLAFHHDTFANSGDPYGDGTLAGATANAHVFADTQTGTYDWGTLSANIITSTNTTYTWTPPSSITGADVLMVAGGGGGGGHNAGGGGAGGLLHYTNQTLSGQKTITIGKGGTGGTDQQGSNGSDTTFTDFDDAIGGGGGGAQTSPSAAQNGGSGGGAGVTGTTPGTGISGQGYGGGTGTGNSTYMFGGGGGSGAAGGNATSSQAGHGGIGTQVNIGGTNYYWAGGGGGTAYTNGTAGNGGLGGGGGGSIRSTGSTAGSGGGSALNSGSDGVNEDGGAGGDGGVHTGGGGGGSHGSTNPGGTGGSGTVLVSFTGNVNIGKTIPKVTGATFDSTNVTFTVQQDSSSSIANIKYTINGGSEQTTPVGTLAVAHNLSGSASITVVAYAVNANGVQISTKKTVTGTIPLLFTNFPSTIAFTGWWNDNFSRWYQLTSNTDTFIQYELYDSSGLVGAEYGSTFTLNSSGILFNVEDTGDTSTPFSYSNGGTLVGTSGIVEVGDSITLWASSDGSGTAEAVFTVPNFFS